LTHDGQFHADEVFAIGLILHFLGNTAVERRREFTPDELNDPDIWIIDQSGRYDMIRHNFDHHHDKALPASNVLVLRYLVKEGVISPDFEKSISKAFTDISDYDTKGPRSFNNFHVNDLIRAYNGIENGFHLALGVVWNYLKGIETYVTKLKTGREVFESGQSIGGMVRVCDEYAMGWETMGSEEFLVFPDKSEWKVLSSDSSAYPIQSTGKEKFLHTNKFIGVYSSKQDAVVAACLSAKIEELKSLVH